MIKICILFLAIILYQADYSYFGMNMLLFSMRSKVMENEIRNFKDTKLKKIKFAIFSDIGVLLVVFGSLYGFQSNQLKVMSTQLDPILVPDGWNLTEDQR
jgi:hypothetical protein